MTSLDSGDFHRFRAFQPFPVPVAFFSNAERGA